MVEILVHGREATPEERTRSSIQLQKLAQEKGWVAKIGYNKFQDNPRTYKTGAKAGQTVEGKIVESVWVHGFKNNYTFKAVWFDNKLDHVFYGHHKAPVKELVTIKQLKEELL